jgi:hypothetical protein
LKNNISSLQIQYKPWTGWLFPIAVRLQCAT